MYEKVTISKIHSLESQASCSENPPQDKSIKHVFEP